MDITRLNANVPCSRIQSLLEIQKLFRILQRPKQKLVKPKVGSKTKKSCSKIKMEKKLVLLECEFPEIDDTALERQYIREEFLFWQTKLHVEIDRVGMK